MQLKHGRRHLCKHDADPLCHVCGILLNIGSGKTLEIENYRWEKIKNPTCVMCHNMGGALFYVAFRTIWKLLKRTEKYLVNVSGFRVLSTRKFAPNSILKHPWRPTYWQWHWCYSTYNLLI
eukprot:188524_1